MNLQEEKPVKSKKNLAIIFIAIAVILFGVGGFFLGKSMNTNNGDNKEENKDNTEIPEPTEITEPIEITDNLIIEKLKKFVEVASYEDGNENGDALQFMQGINDLDDKTKQQLTWNSLINIQKVQEKVTTIPDKYKDDLDLINYDEISIEQFNNEYKSLFNQDPIIDYENPNFGGCPGLYKIDQELGKIYIGRECGGFSPVEYYSKIYKYEEDNSYYYVYQYVGTNDPADNKYVKIKSGEVVDVTTFEGNEELFETVVWKFKKDFSFVSTENKG